MSARAPTRIGDRGFGLIEVIVASGILFLIMYASINWLEKLQKNRRKLNSSLELTALKSQVLDNLSCENTLSDPVNAACLAAGSTFPQYVVLRDSRGSEIVALGGETIGSYTVRARCIPSVGGGIEVRAARLSDEGQSKPEARQFESTNSTWFRNDEVDANLHYNWSHPKADLFQGSSGGGGRLCASYFGLAPVAPTVSCPSGTVKSGTDPLTGAPICVNFSSKFTCQSVIITSTASAMEVVCPAGSVLMGCSVSDAASAKDKDLFFSDTKEACYVAKDGIVIEARCCGFSAP